MMREGKMKGKEEIKDKGRNERGSQQKQPFFILTFLLSFSRTHGTRSAGQSVCLHPESLVAPGVCVFPTYNVNH